MDIQIKCDQQSMQELLNSDPPNGCSISYLADMKESNGTTEIIKEVIVTLSIGITSSVLGAWIYEKIMANKPKRIRIQNTEIEFEKGKIIKLISRIIEHDE